MQALVFVDRPGKALMPLTERTCAALLPVVGKPLVVFALEDLAFAGIREALVIASAHADRLEQELGHLRNLQTPAMRAQLAGGDPPRSPRLAPEPRKDPVSRGPCSIAMIAVFRKESPEAPSRWRASLPQRAGSPPRIKEFR